MLWAEEGERGNARDRALSCPNFDTQFTECNAVAARTTGGLSVVDLEKMLKAQQEQLTQISQQLAQWYVIKDIQVNTALLY